MKPRELAYRVETVNSIAGDNNFITFKRTPDGELSCWGSIGRIGIGALEERCTGDEKRAFERNWAHACMELNKVVYEELKQAADKLAEALENESIEYLEAKPHKADETNTPNEIIHFDEKRGLDTHHGFDGENYIIVQDGTYTIKAYFKAGDTIRRPKSVMNEQCQKFLDVFKKRKQG